MNAEVLIDTNVRAAIQLHRRFQFGYWDAAMIAAAKQLGCRGSDQLHQSAKAGRTQTSGDPLRERQGASD